MDLLKKLQALGEDNWSAGVNLHPMEEEALQVFRGREGREPTRGELEAEVHRLYPPHFQKPPFRTTCPTCGQSMEGLDLADFGDDDIPF